MSKSPWGNIGAWAADAERAEAEELEAAAAQPPPPTFPSLKESVTTAKQKKKTKMSLLEFTTMQPKSAAAPTRGLTHEEMLRLPTGPKERSADEMQQGGGRLGGGFSNYGSRMGPTTGREGRRSYGYEEDDDRRNSRAPEFDQPSRADGDDNWGSTKKQTLPDYNNSGQSTRPGGKYTSLGGGDRADEVDNWGSGKKPIMQTQQQTRSSSFGSGFSRPDQGFGSGSGYSRPEGGRWGRSEDSPIKNDVEIVPKVNKPNPFGAARPREEILAEKGLDWKKMDLESEVKKTGGSRPTSSHSSRPGSSEGVKPKAKVNPFGDAKPREVLLEEKGLDWKKIDLGLEQRRVERPETEEEKTLKEEIEHLKKELLEKTGEDQKTSDTNDVILQKERDLELLTRQLDDKVRYSQKNFERPGSGSGRPPSRSGPHEDPRTGFHDRPPSRPGSYDGYPERPRSRPGSHDSRPGGGYDEQAPTRGGAYTQRSSSFTHGAYQENERPRSHGTGSSWARPSDERQGYQGGGGGGGRGFLGGRETDRSGSRW